MTRLLTLELEAGDLYAAEVLLFHLVCNDVEPVCYRLAQKLEITAIATFLWSFQTYIMISTP